jgi:hypothetical protein
MTQEIEYDRNGRMKYNPRDAKPDTKELGEALDRIKQRKGALRPKQVGEMCVEITFSELEVFEKIRSQLEFLGEG